MGHLQTNFLAAEFPVILKPSQITKIYYLGEKVAQAGRYSQDIDKRKCFSLMLRSLVTKTNKSWIVLLTNFITKFNIPSARFFKFFSSFCIWGKRKRKLRSVDYEKTGAVKTIKVEYNSSCFWRQKSTWAFLVTISHDTPRTNLFCKSWS